MESKEIQSQLWKVLESRDRSLTKGLHRWGEQEKALVERKEEITSLKKAADEKDDEITKNNLIDFLRQIEYSGEIVDWLDIYDFSHLGP